MLLVVVIIIIAIIVITGFFVGIYYLINIVARMITGHLRVLNRQKKARAYVVVDLSKKNKGSDDANNTPVNPNDMIGSYPNYGVPPPTDPNGIPLAPVTPVVPVAPVAPVAPVDPSYAPAGSSMYVPSDPYASAPAPVGVPPDPSYPAVVPMVAPVDPSYPPTGAPVDPSYPPTGAPVSAPLPPPGMEVDPSYAGAPGPYPTA